MFKHLNAYFEAKEREWDAVCLRCGACCGAFDDPCRRLKKGPDGKYFCDDYLNRFGPQVTVGGEKFTCVHITQIVHAHWRNDQSCPYKKPKLPL